MMYISLRDIIKRVIQESIDADSVEDAIDNKYYVRIKYDDQRKDKSGKSKGSRLIRPLAIGTTKKDNPVVRAFQDNGSSRKGAPNYKYFRLDRIESWKPMKHKNFYDIPDSKFGEYNRTGDRSMGTFYKNAQFDDMDGPLNQIRAQRKSIGPKMSTKNVQGPVDARRQWGRNVFTSQPNSKIYKNAGDYIKQRSRDIENGLFDTEKWLDDYKKAEQEAQIQNQTAQPPSSKSGPIPNKNNKYDNNNEPDYDEEDIDLDDWLKHNRSNNF